MTLRKRIKKDKGGADILSEFLNLLGAHKQVPAKFRTFMENNYLKDIKEIIICKTPVQKFVGFALNILSQGKWEEEKSKLNYDDMMHVYMLLIFSNGDIAVLEKNQVLNLEWVDTPE